MLVRDLVPYAALLCCYEPRPHDPRRCGLNSCPSYTPMPYTILPHFANFPPVKSTVLPCNCIGLRSSLEFGCGPPSCGLGATVGWEGRQKFFPGLRRTLHFAAIGAKGPHWNLTMWCRTLVRGGGDLFSTASGPVSTVLRRSGGSILVLVRDLALYAALLCCYEPCPHDSRRCGLTSCPSHTPMPCAILPQFANFPPVKSTVLPCNCLLYTSPSPRDA